MKMLTSVLIIALLAGCTRNPPGDDSSRKTYYHPLPRVEISMFVARDHIVAAYVRHSRGSILFHLSGDNLDGACAVSLCGPNSVIRLSASEHIRFCATRYENFDQSFDMFGDGRIVLVPLPEDDGGAMGVFVNLLSGRRYFLAPSVKSYESLEKIRSLARARPRLTVIVREDSRVQDRRIPQFPEFEQ